MDELATPVSSAAPASNNNRQSNIKRKRPTSSSSDEEPPPRRRNIPFPTAVSLPPHNHRSAVEVPQHLGPERTDYLTYDKRLASFAEWPGQQKPEDLAIAGLSCGASTVTWSCETGMRTQPPGCSISHGHQNATMFFRLYTHHLTYIKNVQCVWIGR